MAYPRSFILNDGSVLVSLNPGWIDLAWRSGGQTGQHFIRPNGFQGARTAELIAVKGGFVGHTYRLLPRRSTWFPCDARVDDMIGLTEVAEWQGSDSPVWSPAAPQRRPASAWSNGCETHAGIFVVDQTDGSETYEVEINGAVVCAHPGAPGGSSRFASHIAAIEYAGCLVYRRIGPLSLATV